MLRILIFVLSFNLLSGQVFAERTVVSEKKLQVSRSGSKAVKEITDLDLLIQRFESIKTLAANFTLEVILGRRKQKFLGDVYIKRPGRLIWSNTHPNKSDSIVINDKTWSIDHDLKQVDVQYEESSKSIMSKLLCGNAKEALNGYFVVENSHGSDIYFEVRPTNNDGLFKMLKIRFKKDSLVSILMLDSFGGRRTVSLRNVNLNGFINDDKFSTKFPKEYQVFDHSIGNTESK